MTSQVVSTSVSTPGPRPVPQERTAPGPPALWRRAVAEALGTGLGVLITAMLFPRMEAGSMDRP